MLQKCVHIYSLKENNHGLHICSGYLYLVIKCVEDVDWDLHSWEDRTLWLQLRALLRVLHAGTQTDPKWIGPGSIQKSRLLHFHEQESKAICVIGNVYRKWQSKLEESYGQDDGKDRWEEEKENCGTYLKWLHKTGIGTLWGGDERQIRNVILGRNGCGRMKNQEQRIYGKEWVDQNWSKGKGLEGGGTGIQRESETCLGWEY